MSDTMNLNLPYLMTDRDRHGNTRLFVRRYGRKIRLREEPGTPQFAKAYSEAMDALEAPSSTDHPNRKKIAAHGTLGWLASRYFESAEFRALDETSQLRRRSIIEECLREPLKPKAKELMRDVPLTVLGTKHIKVLRDRKSALPGAANNRKKYISAMFGWAVENDHMRSNPARDVRRVKYATSGFHTWTADEVTQFEQRHPIGTKARLALGLLLYLGVRKSDVVRLGKQQVSGDTIRLVPRKTRYQRVDISEKPILPVLAEIIAGSPCGELTFLMTAYGRPFTAKGFGGWFRKRCNEAKLPQCSAHGLRKAGATRVAEMGGSDRQLMALYDWTSQGQANTYTKAASKKRLAAEASRLLGGHTENADCPTDIAPPYKALVQQ